MVFSSITFLYYFLPITLIFYFLMPQKLKNLILLIMSLFFYFYGEPKYIIVLIFSCIYNYYFGKLIEKSEHKKIYLIINLITNFGILFYFKYFNFFLENINNFIGTNYSIYIIMPIGISFFTFQATSYIIDIYKGKIKSAKNILTFATYLTLFPQLIAGPIVRYETIEKELKERKVNFETFGNGVRRFVIGLSKKVLLANVLGELSQNLSVVTTKTILSHWIIAISDTLQIYFDFSGYSDMAIGLGLMFGFKFLENFNYPLIAKSITDFWRRWHISLSSWFKDYVYIPLGGSKVSNLKRYRNILIVWMITGFWHGASWNFIVWGLYFAIFLIIEKAFLLKILEKHKILSHVYTILIVVISFVIFNRTNFSDIQLFLENMFGFGNLTFTNIETNYYLKNYTFIILTAIICSMSYKKIYIRIKDNKVFNFIEPIIVIILLILCTAYIVNESFNPFLYFRF